MDDLTPEDDDNIGQVQIMSNGTMVSLKFVCFKLYPSLINNFESLTEYETDYFCVRILMK